MEEQQDEKNVYNYLDIYGENEKTTLDKSKMSKHGVGGDFKKSVLQ